MVRTYPVVTSPKFGGRPTSSYREIGKNVVVSVLLAVARVRTSSHRLLLHSFFPFFFYMYILFPSYCVVHWCTPTPVLLPLLHFFSFRHRVSPFPPGTCLRSSPLPGLFLLENWSRKNSVVAGKLQLPNVTPEKMLERRKVLCGIQWRSYPQGQLTPISQPSLHQTEITRWFSYTQRVGI